MEQSSEDEEHHHVLVGELQQRIRMRKAAPGVSFDELVEIIDDWELRQWKHGNPSWKQWIPLYGILRAVCDADWGKPSIAQREHHFFQFYGSMVYHVGAAVGATFGTVYLVHRVLTRISEG